MEEDIKNMSKEELLEYLEEIWQQLDNIALDQIKIAIAELQYFKDQYKQLEKENEKLKTITQEYNSYLQDSNCDTKIIIADSEYFANGFFKENFIPKSKVKEKIEELKEDEEFYREHDRMYEFESKIKLLQELLED